MRNGKYGFMVVLAAMALSVTHWGKADVEMIFGDREDGDYVVVTTESRNPAKYSLKRCDSEAKKCTQLGKKPSYTLTEIREKAIELSAEKAGSLTGNPKDPRPQDYLLDLVDAIERPTINFNNRSYFYKVKGTVEQFAKTVEKHL